MKVIAALVVLAYLAANVALWYSRPGELVWLLTAAALGVVFFMGFMWYVQRD